MDSSTAPPAPRLDWAYFLDVDGTLVEIAETPERVVVAPGLAGVLQALHAACGGALALVSGRPIADLDRLFRPLALPAAGIHGLERRRGDGTVERAAGESVADLHPKLAAFAAQDPRLRIEDKGASLALHYRAAPELAEKVGGFARDLDEGGDGGLRVLHGKMVVEFYRHRADKGQAIAAFMAEPPFRGRRPVFAGDDVTDEYGFRAIREMCGIAIRVGREGESAAPFRLPSVAALHQWLRSALVAAAHAGGRGAGTTGDPGPLRRGAMPPKPRA